MLSVFLAFTAYAIDSLMHNAWLHIADDHVPSYKMAAVWRFKSWLYTHSHAKGDFKERFQEVPETQLL